MDPNIPQPDADPNPYAAPMAPLSGAEATAIDGQIETFMILNLVLSGLSLMVSGHSAWRLLRELSSSVPTGPGASAIAVDISAGAMAVYWLVAAVIYLVAGVGLSRRRPWGYRAHLVGAVLAAITCVGLVYTVPALLVARRPAFRAAFAPASERDGSGDGR